MIADILEEASVCFQYSGLSRGIDLSGTNRQISYVR
jgi:hypothetical protein